MITARTEEHVSHETAIAIEWIKTTERQLERGEHKLVSTLTNSFDAIVSEWEETGKLRANHRKLDLNKAKEAAVSRLKSGRFPLTLKHFTQSAKAKPTKKMTRQQLIETAKKTKRINVRRDGNVTWLFTGKTLRSMGVGVWDDGSIHRCDIDLPHAKRMTVSDAAKLLKLA